MPRLHFHEGPRELFVHQLAPGRTLVGRSDTCDLALPSESVSRVHCAFEPRAGGWWLLDRSRHGTFVNGLRVDRHLLAHGDRIDIGVYGARFSLHHDDARDDAAVATVPVVQAVHEELVEVYDAGFAAGRAELRFVRGPLEGRRIQLHQARTLVGGPGAGLRLDHTLPPRAMQIRVVRGRAMIEPGEAPVFLAGIRVREITPALPGEEVRLGDHAFVVDHATVRESSRELASFGDMVGCSPRTRRLFGVLARMAAHDAPVLLTGPSGTGKEVAAHGLHTMGLRREGPFVAVNCAAIADTLFESELFGHEKGAFTGAVTRQDGAFQRAHGGTLFLDEIGEMRLGVQAKLLRALESGEIRRVGGTLPEFPDVRIVAATNRDLPSMVRQGAFREDLWFRLAVLTVHLPPLSERLEDVRLIAETLLERHHPGAVLTAGAIEALVQHDWPGNVRELRNVLTRAVVMSGRTIRAEHLRFQPWSPEEPQAPGNALEAAERHAVREALLRHSGNRTRAARELGVPRSSLIYRIRRLGLDLEFP